MEGSVTPTDELDATGIDAAAGAYEKWLVDHGVRHVRHRRSASDRVGMRHGLTMVDFLILAPAPRALAIVFKHPRAAVTPRQEEMLAYLIDAGWRAGTFTTAREAIAETVRVVCGGAEPLPVERTSGRRARD